MSAVLDQVEDLLCNHATGGLVSLLLQGDARERVGVVSDVNDAAMAFARVAAHCRAEFPDLARRLGQIDDLLTALATKGRADDEDMARLSRLTTNAETDLVACWATVPS